MCCVPQLVCLFSWNVVPQPESAVAGIYLFVCWYFSSAIFVYLCPLCLFILRLGSVVLNLGLFTLGLGLGLASRVRVRVRLGLAPN